MIDKAAIVAIIREILLHADTGISEYALLKILKKRCVAFAEQPTLDEKLSLFRNHFVVMNALYYLQQELLVENLYVVISALDIRIEKKTADNESALSTQFSNQKIRDYYLNWDNFENTGADDVDELLSSFWQRYVAQDQQQAAMQQLELPQEVSWEKIKKQYRRLASQHHPDKGGDAQNFKNIRNAYEILQRYHR